MLGWALAFLIIALIAAVVGPRLFAQLDRSKTTAARIQAKAIKGALETMRIDIGRLPSQQEGLNLLIQADATTVPGCSRVYSSLCSSLTFATSGHANTASGPSTILAPASR